MISQINYLICNIKYALIPKVIKTSGDNYTFFRLLCFLFYFLFLKYIINREFIFNTCAKLIHKQLLVNKTKLCSSYIYYALNATSKFNFEPLFGCIKIFNEYLKHSIIQNNNLKSVSLHFPIFT